MVSGYQYLSMLDLVLGFNQLSICPFDQYKIAFITPMGHFQLNKLRFKFVNGPSVFQREFDNTIGSLKYLPRPFIDDLVTGNSDNHKRYDAKLQVFLFNLY